MLNQSINRNAYRRAFEKRRPFYAGAFLNGDVGSDDDVRPNAAIGADFCRGIYQDVANNSVALI